MEREYFVTFGVKGQPNIFAAVGRLCIAPHEEPKGTILEGMLVDSVYEQTAALGSPDVIDIYSACELPAAPWCIGHSREVVVGGRAATLEAGAAGWRIHI